MSGPTVREVQRMDVESETTLRLPAPRVRNRREPVFVALVLVVRNHAR